jgi:hypothetical protein
MLTVSLSCLFLIAPSVFSNVYLHIIMEKNGYQIVFVLLIYVIQKNVYKASVFIIRGNFWDIDLKQEIYAPHTVLTV